MALDNNCGVIQMEDLSGIASNEKKKTMLGYWTYHDLQEKVKYKAKEVGIEVIFIKPRYTSQRCSECGYIHRDNRPKDRKGQAHFECIECGYKENADYNAARNIATPNIERIIEAQLEQQEEKLKHTLKYAI